MNFLEGKKKMKNSVINEDLGFIFLVPTAFILIFVSFFLLCVVPYHISTGLRESKMTAWIESNIEVQEIEYIEEFGDGQWSPKYFLYSIDGKQAAFYCWNKKTGWGEIDCKQVTLEEYRERNKR